MAKVELELEDAKSIVSWVEYLKHCLKVYAPTKFESYSYDNLQKAITSAELKATNPTDFSTVNLNKSFVTGGLCSPEQSSTECKKTNCTQATIDWLKKINENVNLLKQVKQNSLADDSSTKYNPDPEIEQLKKRISVLEDRLSPTTSAKGDSAEDLLKKYAGVRDSDESPIELHIPKCSSINYDNINRSVLGGGKVKFEPDLKAEVDLLKSKVESLEFKMKVVIADLS